MRILTRILGGLVALLFVGAVAVYFLSEGARKTLYTAPPTALAITASSDTYARGEYLSHVLGCRECHGDDLGGRLMADAPPFRIEPPNLTTGEGGVGANYDAEDWERAVRHAIGPDGRGLYIMGASAYRNLSDDDMAALVAYLESVPPVDGQFGGVMFKPLGRALLAFGVVRPEVVTDAVAIAEAPAAGPTAAYGHYLASLTCMHCHGATLEGGPSPEPGQPDVPSLRAAAHWDAAQFDRTLRQGLHPDGRQLDPVKMPWRAFAVMNAEDVQALHNYLRELEGRPTVAGATAEVHPE